MDQDVPPPLELDPNTRLQYNKASSSVNFSAPRLSTTHRRVPIIAKVPPPTAARSRSKSPKRRSSRSRSRSRSRSPSAAAPHSRVKVEKSRHKIKLRWVEKFIDRVSPDGLEALHKRMMARAAQLRAHLETDPTIKGTSKVQQKSVYQVQPQPLCTVTTLAKPTVLPTQTLGKCALDDAEWKAYIDRLARINHMERDLERKQRDTVDGPQPDLGSCVYTAILQSGFFKEGDRVKFAIDTDRPSHLVSGSVFRVKDDNDLQIQLDHEIKNAKTGDVEYLKNSICCNISPYSVRNLDWQPVKKKKGLTLNAINEYLNKRQELLALEYAQ